MKRVFSLLVLSIFCGVSQSAHAACGSQESAGQELPDDLTTVGLEQLLSFDIEVTSPAKKKQKYSEVASAIYVLTHEDIRRSGVTHVAEALRMVPGISVARINTNRWAISARGFNSSFANKLLVLVDGQSIFTPGFNGVFWDQHELLLEDIDRIEVIRGPGAAIWGSNAVNGVINIITCSAKHTQGNFVSAGGGTEEQLMTSMRHGGKLGEDTFYRVYGKFSRRDESKLVSGGDSADDYSSSLAGVRFDSDLNERDTLTVKTEGFIQDEDYPVVVPSIDPPFADADTFSGDKEQWGVNFLTDWTRKLSADSELDLHLDYTFERQKGLVFPLKRHTFHVNGHHRFSPFADHDLIYGAGYRFYYDDIEGNFADDFDPESRDTHLYTAFFHDEISIIPETLRFIIGSKFELNSHTGFEFMPNGRLLWTPNKTHSIWLAASRAVANPSRVQDDVIGPIAAFPEPMSGLPALVTLFGDRDTKAEDLTALEVGYRFEASEEFSLDITGFVNMYDDFVSGEPGAPFVGTLKGQARPALIIPIVFDNQLEATGHGVELALEWVPQSWLRLVGSYSYININVDTDGSLDTTNEGFFEGGSPENQFNIRSQIDLPQNVEFDSQLRYVDHLSAGDIDSYFELDLRLAWRPWDDFEIAVVGQNLIEDSHQEFQGIILSPPSSEIERSVYGKLTWSF